MMILDQLGEYDVQDFRSNPDSQGEDKIRVTFKIRDQNLAIKCYQDFCMQNKSLVSDAVKV